MIRNLLVAFILILWWVFAMYGLVVQKAPDLKKEYDKIIPYQWVIWVIILIMWIIKLFSIFSVLWSYKYWFIWPTLELLVIFTLLILWFVLSFWLIAKYVLSIKDPQKKKKKWRKKKWETTWQEKTQNMYTTLTYVQVPFWALALLLWLLLFFFSFISLFQ